MKILPVKVKMRLITRKQRHHVLLNVMMLLSYVIFPYYLVKLSKDPFRTSKSVKDDYGYYLPANTKVIEGNYLEIFKETKERDLYYLDTSKLAIVSCFSVVGICPEFVEVEQMRRKKIETMFLLAHDMHQLLLEYTICGFLIPEFELFLYLF